MTENVLATLESLHSRLERLERQANLGVLHGGSRVVTEDDIYTKLVSACRGRPYRLEVTTMGTNRWRIKCGVSDRWTQYDLAFREPLSGTGWRTETEERGYYVVDGSGQYDSVEAAARRSGELLKEQRL